MYFRNKFNEEFLLLANNIEPKGGSVRLDQKNPLFFEIRQPAFDEVGRYVEVIPLLLYNRIKTKYSETKLDNDIIDKDKIVEDWIALCVNRKDNIITCWYDDKYISEQGNDYICNVNIVEVTGDLYQDEDYDYEELSETWS